MENLKITKGDAKVSYTTAELENCVVVGDKRVAQFKSFGNSFNDASPSEREANTKLYIDTHNTYNKHPKLPSQLLSENEEMKQHLKDLLNSERLSLTAKTFTEQLLTKLK
jgi:hypothetical protein